MGLLNSRFYKKILGIFFFGDAVYKDIHEEIKKKITTNFEVKVKEFNSPIIKFLKGKPYLDLFEFQKF
jgi:hypothetical protein